MTITVETAQTQLKSILHQLAPGEQVEITENGNPVAYLMGASKINVSEALIERPVPRLGTLAGTVLSMEHFDDPLEEFEEYM